MEAFNIALAWTAFAVFHSLTVSDQYERLARRFLGDRTFDGYHRLIFTAYSVAAFLLLMLYLRGIPDRPVYRLEGVARITFHAIQLCAAAFLLWTPWDLLEFLGFRQWERHRSGVPAPPAGEERLFTEKAYGVVRHPLYLGCSVILAFHPVQTRTSLVSAGMIILYFYVGTFLEERRLLRKFGDAYREYRRKVPRFLPIRFRR